MITSKWRGHEIYQVNEHWLYVDTNEKVADNPDRKCGHCSKENTADDHDGCLGTLPMAKNACCGHGSRNECYVQFNNKIHVGGCMAIVTIYMLKLIRKVLSYMNSLVDALRKTC
jgi:hypothetical protein